jgi:hypothetical protein
LLAGTFAALTSLAITSTASAASAPSLDAVFFLSAQGVDTSVDESVVDRDDSNIAGDVLLTGSYGSLRTLIETLVSTEEIEIERVQVGWEPRPELVLWLGRFHQASSYWNTEFHHGQFLQTSITRPAIESWEDDEGPLPQHFTGLLTEYSLTLRNGGAFRGALGLGAVPVLDEHELEPSNVTDALHDHKFGVSARIDWLPDALGDTSLGVVAGHSEISYEPGPAASLLAGHFDLTTIGGYFDVHTGSTRYLGALYRISANLGEGEVPNKRHLLSYYAQVEQRVANTWQAYARYEETPDVRESVYFSLFPGFVSRRYLAGARWDFHSKNAITLEYGRVTVLGEQANEWRLQWSAVLP